MKTGWTTSTSTRLGCDPGDQNSNDDGRPDGEEADARREPLLAHADWAAYGTALFSVRVDRPAPRTGAGVSVGHITRSGCGNALRPTP